jgi:hypothetical protein
MTVADAGAAADGGPLWLRIVIALVPPVLAAILAGYFALSNTVNRRAERLKNLNDIRVSSNSEWINPDYALERIILRELKELDRATTPIIKWQRRFYYLAGLVGFANYGILAVIFLRGTWPKSHIVGKGMVIFGGISLVIIAIAFINGFRYKAGEIINERYSRGVATLDERAVQAHEYTGESEEQVVPESEFSAKPQQPIQPTQYVGSDFVSRLSQLTACVWLSVMVVRLIAAARRTLVKSQRRRP